MTIQPCPGCCRTMHRAGLCISCVSVCAHGMCSCFRLHPSVFLQEHKLACRSSRQKSPFHFVLIPCTAGIGFAQSGTHPWAAVSHPSCLLCQALAQGLCGVWDGSGWYLLVLQAEHLLLSARYLPYWTCCLARTMPLPPHPEIPRLHF